MPSKNDRNRIGKLPVQYLTNDKISTLLARKNPKWDKKVEGLGTPVVCLEHFT